MLDWRGASAILATLYLNFLAFNESPMRSFVSLSGAAVAACVVALFFFAGPALAVNRSGRGLFEEIDQSVGRVAGIGLRLAAAAYSICWLVRMLQLPLWWIEGQDWSTWAGLKTYSIITLLVLTAASPKSWTSLVTASRIGNAVAVAVLAAALIHAADRMPYSHPVVVFDRQDGEQMSRALDMFGPVIFLGATLGCSLKGAGQVLKTAAAGLALPMLASFIALLLIWSAVPNRLYYILNFGTFQLLILAVTCAGAARFLLRFITQLVLREHYGTVRRFAVLATTAMYVSAIFRWLRFDSPTGMAAAQVHTLASSWSSVALAAIAAILTAGYLAPSPKWVGLAALLAGFATAITQWFDGERRYWHPELFSCYAVTFLIFSVAAYMVRWRQWKLAEAHSS